MKTLIVICCILSAIFLWSVRVCYLSERLENYGLITIRKVEFVGRNFTNGQCFTMEGITEDGRPIQLSRVGGFYSSPEIGQRFRVTANWACILTYKAEVQTIQE